MISFEDVSLVRGGKTVVAHLNAELPEEGVIAVLGPSGSGKTTLLRAFAGLLVPASGRITGLADKRCAFVFQEDRLMSFLTARENVAFVDGARGADECLALVELTESAGKKAAELSGGMQRRVAIARALRAGGDVLILDEPFKGLDDALRERICQRLRGLFPLTVIATHDEGEAALLGNPSSVRPAAG